MGFTPSRTSPNRSIEDHPCSRTASLASREKLVKVLISSHQIPFGTGRILSIPNNFNFSGSPSLCLNQTSGPDLVVDSRNEQPRPRPAGSQRPAGVVPELRGVTHNHRLSHMGGEGVEGVRHVTEVDPPPLDDLCAASLLNKVFDTLLSQLDHPFLGH